MNGSLLNILVVGTSSLEMWSREDPRCVECADVALALQGHVREVVTTDRAGNLAHYVANLVALATRKIPVLIEVDSVGTGVWSMPKKFKGAVIPEATVRSATTTATWYLAEIITQHAIDVLVITGDGGAAELMAFTQAMNDGVLVIACGHLGGLSANLQDIARHSKLGSDSGMLWSWSQPLSHEIIMKHLGRYLATRGSKRQAKVA